MKMGIGALMRAVSQQKTKKAKLDLLQTNKSPALASYLRHVFDPNLKFLLPEGEFEYTPLSNMRMTEPTHLAEQIKRFYIFVEGGNPLLKTEQRNVIFKNLLESLDPLDAEAVIAMKDKKLPYNIPRKLIEEAYPGFLPEETN